MGAAKRRKALGLPPAPAPARVREITLELPLELAKTLEDLCPTPRSFREWLVGALAAFAEYAQNERQRAEAATRLVIPARTMPRLPPGAMLGGRT